MTESGALTYRLTEEQVLLRDTLRDLAEERIAPRAAECPFGCGRDRDDAIHFPEG